MGESTWLFCPVCKGKTRDRILEETVMTNFPLFCPKCKQTTLINIENLKMTIIKEPVAEGAVPETQSR